MTVNLLWRPRCSSNSVTPLLTNSNWRLKKNRDSADATLDFLGDEVAPGMNEQTALSEDAKRQKAL
jgi:hypothetical protein